MPDEIERKDILNRIEKLNDLTIAGFARNETLGEAMKEQLIRLNGKVAEHEKRLTDMAIKEAVQNANVVNLQKNEDNHVADNKKFDSMIKGNFWGVIFNLIAMGLVALITFYLTSR